MGLDSCSDGNRLARRFKRNSATDTLTSKPCQSCVPGNRIDPCSNGRASVVSIQYPPDLEENVLREFLGGRLFAHDRKDQPIHLVAKLADKGFEVFLSDAIPLLRN